MAAPWQGLPVRLEWAPHRGAAFALSNASKRARTRSIGCRGKAFDRFLGPILRGDWSRGLAGSVHQRAGQGPFRVHVAMPTKLHVETPLPIPLYAHSGIDLATRDDEPSPVPAARWPAARRT